MTTSLFTQRNVVDCFSGILYYLINYEIELMEKSVCVCP